MKYRKCSIAYRICTEEEHRNDASKCDWCYKLLCGACVTKNKTHCIYWKSDDIFFELDCDHCKERFKCYTTREVL
jgi:hypothetical protein